MFIGRVEELNSILNMISNKLKSQIVNDEQAKEM